jgi:DNA-damage-inducible protein D
MAEEEQNQKKEIQQKLMKTLEDIKRIRPDGSEYWSARDLSPLLEYERWESFSSVIDRAIISCKTTGMRPTDHFRPITKLVPIGSGGTRSISDYELSRYACYIIAQNGDPSKMAVAAAQMYFASQTRKQEVKEQQLIEVQRLEARKKLTATEKNFSKALVDRGIDGKGIGIIRSDGDKVLFGGHSTAQMKAKMGIKDHEPLADYLPTVTIKAKDLAAEITTVNTHQKDLHSPDSIRNEHVVNNKGVRDLLHARGIKPEELPAEEDVKRIARRHDSLKHIAANAKQAQQITKDVKQAKAITEENASVASDGAPKEE